MKVIIAGSRKITDANVVKEAIEKSSFEITMLITGCARGVDLIGEMIARNLNIPISRFPADWDRFGNAAGPMRNLNMAKSADALIAVWDGESKGTKHIIRTMTRQKKLVYVHKVEDIKL